MCCSPGGRRVRHDEQLNNNQVLSTRAHGHTYSSHNPGRKELFGAHCPIRDPRLGDGDTVGLHLDGSDDKGSTRRGGLPPGTHGEVSDWEGREVSLKCESICESLIFKSAKTVLKSTTGTSLVV